MKHTLLTLLLLFGIIGCATGVAEKFPISSYSNDKNSVELHFACLSGSACIAGLYIDYMQVYEGFGEYTLAKGGLQKDTKYIIKIPEDKYLFSPNVVNNFDSFDRFISVKGKTCVTIQKVSIGLNIFAPIKNNEGSWVRVDCLQFNELTKDYEEVILQNPVSFVK